MQKIAKSFVFITIFSLLLTQQIFAADAPTTKIGVIDMQSILGQSDPAKSAQKQLESKYGKEKQEIDKQGEALKKRAEGLKNPKTTKKEQEAFIRSKQDLDNKTRNFLRKIEQDQTKLQQELVNLIFKATANISKAKGYSFVVDVTAGGVIFAEQSMDLTKEVMEEVNKLYKEGSSKKEEKPADKKENTEKK